MRIEDEVKVWAECECTLRVRQCGVGWCVKAIGPDGRTTEDGLWLCDACRQFCERADLMGILHWRDEDDEDEIDG